MRLESLFTPASIAVIGASTRPGTVGHTLTRNLLADGYTGKVYPVNPKAERLFDLPCYATISAIPDPVELAIIIVPAAVVPGVLREAGTKGVSAAIIISSGFKETGAAGKALEDQVAAIAHEFDVALLGPNCLGFLNPSIGLNASFANALPATGSIAFFSQSGALCTALLDLSRDRLGYSHFVSTGNKAVIDENALLRFFAQDDSARVLGFYSEGLRDSRALIATGRAILADDRSQPVIALKSGQTEAGTQASSSHTGALAGSDAAYTALFRQARMIRANSLEHLLDLFMVFSHNPSSNGSRLAIITNAGGLGVLATDAAVRSGLTLAKLSPETEDRLKGALPAAANIHNPVDVLGDALSDRYRAALESVADDPQVDMLLVIVTPQTMTEAEETAEAIVEVKKRSDKPVIAVFCGAASLREGWTVLQKNGIAAVLYPEAGAEAFSALAQVAKWRQEKSATLFRFDDIDRDKAADIFKQVREAGRSALSETEAWEVLKAYGFPFLRSRVAHHAEEAAALAREFAVPVALKIVSPDISHKSDAGGVALNVTAETAAETYATMLRTVRERQPEAKLEGALVVEMAETGGREIILGMKREPGLGNLLMVGLGGIFVETFKDVAFRFSPLTREDAAEMLHELKSLPLLQGARGQAGADLDALTEHIGRLSRLVEDFPEIAELDINPLLVFPDAARFRVLDARIRIDH